MTRAADIGPPVALLLSTYNGEAFLPAQLESFLAQQDAPWKLYWRDDGSSDASVAVMQAFASGAASGRCVRLDAGPHLGVTASYMALLRAAVADGAAMAMFSDQDDVWLPDKIRRGVARLEPIAGAALYCSRQVLVDGSLHPICGSEPIRVPPGLGPALTQNIATGCTVVLNRAAAELVARSAPPGPSLHDWWSYLLVTAAGGQVVFDAEPTVLYRQHGANAVGAPPSKRKRAVAALRRGPGAFMTVFRAQVHGLHEQSDLLSPSGRAVVGRIERALSQGWFRRLLVLRHCRMLRQGRGETWLFRLWFILG